MGEVYLAEDQKLKRKAAIKFISASLVRDEAQRLRFVQEATLAASIDHPHIAAIYDVEQIDGQTFIAMQLVEGTTLRDRVLSGQIGIAEALRYLLQISDGLTEAHRKGIVHRDMKSSNIMITPAGRAVIM